jgi:hypothetical protein
VFTLERLVNCSNKDNFHVKKYLLCFKENSHDVG